HEDAIMKSFEFIAPIRADRTITVPAEFAGQLPADRMVRVVLLLADEEDREWNALTAAGYRLRTKLGFENSTSKPHTIYVEPWTPDYTLLPGEELQICAFANAAMPWFNIVKHEGGS